MRAAMITLLAVRLARLAVTLLLISGAVFSLQSLVPSDPLAAIPSGGQPPTAEELRQQLAPNAPITYAGWIRDVARGELGQSLATGKPVAALLQQAAPASMQLMLMAVIAALAIVAPLAAAARISPSWRSIADGVALAGLS